jgi:hypothetical protein
MKRIFSKYIDKLFFKKWIIGIYAGDIKDIIRSKSFDPDITWLFLKPFDKYHADPFLVRSNDGNFKIMIEQFIYNEGYGKITLLTLDKNFRPLSNKVVLDTKSHLSYPFIFTENGKNYVFPEAGQSGKLSCYEYDNVNESLSFVKDILELPLRDSSILKRNGKYWIFSSVNENDKDYKLLVFFSENLLGPYVAHPGNPLNSGLDGIRPAGDFIEVDGTIYRPSQNCKKEYGESITIQKIIELDEKNLKEEPYMTLNFNTSNRLNFRMTNFHTLNVLDNYIVVDGIKATFSPVLQLKSFLRNRTNQNNK